MLDKFLATLSPMRAAKARAALETQVRVNGAEFMFRHQLIERRVSDGATVKTRRGEAILENPDGSFLDARNATVTGLNYARYLTA